MALFTPQDKLRALLDSIDNAANVVRSHGATLNPFAWDPIASVVLVVVVVACSSYLIVISATSSNNIDVDPLASADADSAPLTPRRPFD